MKVQFNKQEKVFFQSLEIGETYLDEAGVLCIKAGEIEPDKDFAPVLAFLDEGWTVDSEHQLARVTKVKSTLVIGD